MQRAYGVAGGLAEVPASDIGEHAVEGSRHVGKIERVDENVRIADLPAVGAAQEASQLGLDASSSPIRLLLEGPEGAQIASRVEDGLDRAGTKSTDQLVLEVFDADVETQLLHVGASEAGGEPGSLKAAPEHLLLARVTDAGERCA